MNIVKKPREKIVMAKKKNCSKKCDKKCSVTKKNSKPKKATTFDNRLSAVETINTTNDCSGFFTKVYRYFFPTR